jgi:hypothetical protein
MHVFLDALREDARRNCEQDRWKLDKEKHEGYALKRIWLHGADSGIPPPTAKARPIDSFLRTQATGVSAARESRWASSLPRYCSLREIPENAVRKAFIVMQFTRTSAKAWPSRWDWRSGNRCMDIAHRQFPIVL